MGEAAKVAPEYRPSEVEVAGVKKRCLRDTEFAIHVMQLIYTGQTPEEREAGRDLGVRNGRGFAPHETEMFSGFCQTLKRGQNLSMKQLDVIRDRVGKYARQFLVISEERRRAMREGRDPDAGDGREASRPREEIRRKRAARPKDKIGDPFLDAIAAHWRDNPEKLQDMIANLPDPYAGK